MADSSYVESKTKRIIKTVNWKWSRKITVDILKTSILCHAHFWNSQSCNFLEQPKLPLWKRKPGRGAVLGRGAELGKKEDLGRREGLGRGAALGKGADLEREADLGSVKKRQIQESQKISDRSRSREVARRLPWDSDRNRSAGRVWSLSLFDHENELYRDIEAVLGVMA